MGNWVIIIVNFILVELLRSSQATQIVISACQALGNIFRSGRLPLPTAQVGEKGGGGGGEAMETEDGEGETVTKAMLVECLVQLSKTAKHDKVCV